jgi:hypothetical protein
MGLMMICKVIFLFTILLPMFIFCIRIVYFN